MSGQCQKTELLQELENRKNEWYDDNLTHYTRNYKTVLLGACGVGKTSLVNRHVRGIFNSESESTIGASFCTNKITTSIGDIMLSIWDTAGQERYASLVPLYYRGAGIVLVVFDMTNIESFNRAKQWIDTIEDSITNSQGRNSNVTIILIGNKIDKGTHIIRKLEEDARVYANTKDILFIKTSARNGNGVIEVFATAIIEKLRTEMKEKHNYNDDKQDTVCIEAIPERNIFASCLGMIPIITPSYWTKSNQIPNNQKNNDSIN